MENIISHGKQAVKTDSILAVWRKLLSFIIFSLNVNVNYVLAKNITLICVMLDYFLSICQFTTPCLFNSIFLSFKSPQYGLPKIHTNPCSTAY